jgi:hypothetical protein
MGRAAVLQAISVTRQGFSACFLPASRPSPPWRTCFGHRSAQPARLTSNFLAAFY